MTETEAGIGIVGAGRAGSALARRLAAGGHAPRMVASRSPSSAARLAESVGAEVGAGAAQVASQCGVTLLTVPDGQLGVVAAEIAAAPMPLASSVPRVLAHCAGSLGPEVLAACSGFCLGVLHPVAPIPDGDPACLEGALASLEGAPEAVEVLGRLAAWMGLEPLLLGGLDRTRYHAACVLAGVLPVLLEEQSERLLAGAGEAAGARRGLRRLLALAAANVERLGPREARTGPSTRGDGVTGATDLEALRAGDERLASIYRLTLELAAGSPAS